MESPQKENGYTPIANEIMDALCRTRISGEERQVLDVIFRKTYGWNKKNDRISLSQFAELTGLPKRSIIRGINKLQDKNIISVVKNVNKPAHLYEFNKHYKQWGPFTKKTPFTKLTPRVHQTVNKQQKPFTKKRTTKALKTKDTTKDKSIIPFQEIIDDLNEVLGTRYSTNTASTKKLITARWNEGFRLDDFKRVHRTMHTWWSEDGEMSQYLRPQTLYTGKFDSYLNRPAEKPGPKTKYPWLEYSDEEYDEDQRRLREANK